MADIDVQPKRKSRWWLWLLLAIILIALLLFFVRSCNDNNTSTTGTDTTSVVTGVTTPSGNMPDGTDWDNIDRNAPEATYEEVTDTNIRIRGNDNYGIYSLGENILFDENESTIRKDAEANLKQVATSIEKRFKGGNIRIYGYTDATGSAGYNRQLAEQRAEAVRNWLFANGGIAISRISVNAVGETKPVSSNNTAQGREQNRRVEIVVRKAQ